MGEVIQMDQQKAIEQLNAYIDQIGEYAGINKSHYKELMDAVDSFDPSHFDDDIGELPEGNEKIVEGHEQYKSIFGKAKEALKLGGELDRLFEEFKSLYDPKEPSQEAQDAFKGVDGAYQALINGIVNIYQPGLIDIYSQLRQDEVTAKGIAMIGILKKYKADEILESMKRAQEEQE